MNKIINLANGVIVIIIVFVVIGFAGLFLIKSNPAPGCNQIPGISGGCFSKFVIINEKIEPKISCLKFSSNNCNWPYLSIASSCKKPVYINGVKIPREECTTLRETYWIMKNNGKYEIVSRSELDLFSLSKEEFLSKSKESCIEEYEKISFDLKLGDKEYNIQFNGDEYANHGPSFMGSTSHNVVGSPGNCLNYSLRNYYNTSCRIMELSTNCEENIELMDQVIKPNKNCKIINSYMLLDTEDKTLYYKGKQYYQGEQIPPLSNKEFFVDGIIGEKEFKISFTVTKKCN